MTSKERVLAALRFERPDRTPFNFWMDRRLMAQYEEKYGEDWRVKVFDADVVETFPLLPFPSSTVVEESGTTWVAEPLLKSMDDVDSLVMPDPLHDDVYRQVRRDVETFPDRAVFLDAPGVLTIAHGMREYANLMLDVYDSPEQVKTLFDRISDVMAAAVRGACKLGVTAVYVMDDVACRQGLLMSLPMLEEFVFPYNQKMIDAGKEAGLPVLMHCCGATTEAMASFEAQGVNALNPLQPHLHDLRSFAEKYRGRLAVYGALDNTYIIPDGTPDEIRAHVRQTYEILGRDGGLIFSTHDIPLYTPEENILAMVDEIKKCTD